MAAALPPLGGLVLLVWLAYARYSRLAVVVSAVLLPLLVWIAPSPIELGFTIAVETPIVWALCVMLGLDHWRAAFACLFINVVTQPLLYLALAHIPGAHVTSWRTAFVIAEVCVWVVEALVYLACLESLRIARRPLLKAFGISLAANGASALLGLLLPI